MPSEIIKLARKIAKRDKATFDSLIEFENLGRLNNKERMNFTIDKSLASRFKRICRNKGYSMSHQVEEAIRNIVVKEEK